MTFKQNRALRVILIVVVIANVYIFWSGNTYIYKALLYNFPAIDNYAIFPKRVLHASPNPEPWPFSPAYNKQNLSEKLVATLEEYQTTAFLVIKDDSLIVEHYWDDYSPAKNSNSFSMAKSYISTLIGCAVYDKSIGSVDQPVAHYLPTFRNPEKDSITIRHLLNMSSGLDWDESYSGPFSITTKAYYGTNLDELVSNLEVARPPGTRFNYISGNTQILAMVLRAATGKTVTQYAQEKLWNPMGFEHESYWSVDKRKGTEKAYCCINSTARDFARIIKLYLDEGKWNGKTLLSPAYVKEALTPASYTEKGFNDYGFQWWLLPHYNGHNIFYARGILGQYAIGIPDQNLIIVRLGHQRGKKVNMHPSELYIYIDEVLKTFQHEHE